jgi:hypothetical protein
MAIFKVFEQLRLRKADNAAGYHLLGTESDPLEKADEIETYASNVEPNELSVDGKMPPKRMFALRCLRKLGVLLPSFIHPSSAHFGPQRLRPTAWLGQYI